MSEIFKDYYAILEISPDSSLSEIKNAFRKQIKKWHPDKNSDPRATEKTQEILEAFLILKDPIKRSAYDAEYKKRKFQEEQAAEAFEYEGNIENEDLGNWVHEAHQESKRMVKETLREVLDILKSGFILSLRWMVILFLGFSGLSLLIFIISISSAVKEKSPEYVTIELLDNLPTFTPEEEYFTHKIYRFGEISVPYYMERIVPNRADHSNPITSELLEESGRDKLYPVVYFQLSSDALTALDSEDRFARISIGTENIQDDRLFPNLNDPLLNVDTLYYKDLEFYKVLREFISPTGVRIVQWYPSRIVKINGLCYLLRSYKQKLGNDPDILVDTYYHRHNNDLYTILFSYREADTLVFREGFEKVMNNLVLDIP